MRQIRIAVMGLVVALGLVACASNTQQYDTEFELGIGCTEDIVSYKKELKKLLEESEDKEAEARLKQIIEFVECEDPR